MYYYNIKTSVLYIVFKKLILYILTWNNFLGNIYIGVYRGDYLQFNMVTIADENNYKSKGVYKNMGIYKDLKKVFVSTIDVLADKTSTQAQKSRLVTVMKNEEKIANQAYIALGKYLYTSMRSNLPEDVEQLCGVIDASKERMTRAQDIYREVIHQEQINSEIGRTEVKENFRKVKEPIVAGAANTAAKATSLVKDTAKDTAAKAGNLRAAAAERAEDIRTKMHKEKAVDECVEQEAEAADPTVEVLEDIPEPIVVNETTKTEAKESAAAVEITAVESDEPESEPQPEEDSAIPMPVDVISEEEFEENEPTIIKNIEKKPISKARKLKDIITKKDNK